MKLRYIVGLLFTTIVFGAGVSSPPAKVQKLSTGETIDEFSINVKASTTTIVFTSGGIKEYVKEYHGFSNIVANSTQTIVLTGAIAIQDVPIITTQGNYYTNIFIYDIWASSFTIRNVGNDTVKTGWRVITK